MKTEVAPGMALAEFVDKGKLRWLLRRGMKELDVLTERYYARRWPAASEQERAAFVKMLSTTEDPDLYSWAMGYSPAPAEFNHVIEQLRRHPDENVA